MNKVTFESNCVENGKLTTVKEGLEFNTMDELFSFLKGKPYSKELKNEINLNIYHNPFKKSVVTENGFNLFTYTFEKPIESTKTEKEKTLSEKRKEQQEKAREEIIKKYKSVDSFTYTVLTEDEKEYRANFISRTGDLRGVEPCAIIKDNQHTYYSHCANKMQEIEVAEDLLGEFNIISYFDMRAIELMEILNNIIGKKVLMVILNLGGK